MDMEGTSHKSRFARVIKGRMGVEESTMVLEEDADVCSIWLSITILPKFAHTALSAIFSFGFHLLLSRFNAAKDTGAEALNQC